jgi:hypothetical protein
MSLATVANPYGLSLRRLMVCWFVELQIMGKAMHEEDVMDNIRSAFKRSGMTLSELGQGLGYDGPTAKKRAWSLLYRTPDPRISTVIAVAQTLGVNMSKLIKM